MIGPTFRNISSQLAKGKKDFVLDCCNSRSSNLKPYNSEKDIFLANYFLIKRYKDQARSLNKKAKPQKNQPEKKLFTSSSAPKINQSITTRSLPPIDEKRISIKPISREDFKSLIKRFRKKL